MRYCPDCRKELPETAFYIAGKHKDGSPIYRNVCKMHYSRDCIDARYPDRAVAVAIRRASRHQPVTDPHKRAAFRRIMRGVQA